MWWEEIVALALSCIIEGPVSYMLGRKMKWPCRGPKHMGWASVAATCITHPQIYGLAQYLKILWGFWPTFWVIEAIVVVAEGFLICWMAGLKLNRAMITSLIANAASAFFGVLLTLLVLGRVE